MTKSIFSKDGRPPKFDNPKDLQKKIDEYIKNPDKRKVVIDGKELEIDTYTITGLCLYCGFSSRQSFYEYEKKPDFTYTIKTARTFIESKYEMNLQSQSCTGSIFALKSMGWNDKEGENKDEPLAESISKLIDRLPD